MIAGFVSSLIWISSRLKSHSAAFLSEAFRSYILRCVCMMPSETDFAVLTQICGLWLTEQVRMKAH
jgi:hypothetical protein